MPQVSKRRIFVGFISLWFIKAPLYVVTLLKRSLQLLNRELAVGLMFRLLLVPLFGDQTIIGWIIGFIFRALRILVGLIAFSVCFLFFVGCFLLWTSAPIWLFLTLKLYAAIPFAASALAYYFYLFPKPQKKISKLTKYDPPLLAAPQKLVKALNSSHYLENLLRFPEVQEFITRLGIDQMEFNRSLLDTDASIINKESLINLAIKEGLKRNTKYLQPKLIFYCLFKITPIFDTILTKYELTTSLLGDTLNWLIYLDEIRQPLNFFSEDYTVPPMGGVNRGWTAKPTPTLDEYSEDFTKETAKGLLIHPIAKDKIINNMIEILTRKTRQNILLVGEPGCGKTSAVMGMAYKIIEGEQSPALRFKRLVSLDVGALIAGAETPGAINARVSSIVKEIKNSRNVILFVDEVHNLAATLGNDPNSSSIFSTLEPHLSAGEFDFIGATSISNYKKYIEPNNAFARVLERVTMEEATPEETMQILKYETLELEKENQVIVSYQALSSIIELSKKLIHDRVLPDKAIDILENSCIRVKNAGHKLVTKADVEEYLTKLTRVPVINISKDESQKLLNLEAELHERIVGQSEAVKAIANSMQRARVGLRDENKPIASFLFVGPTGVGKTETAKALADSYFGNEKLMVRIDMSEYQEANSVERLIGKPGGKTGGILTEAVRSQPFALVLLDEVEKAHPNITLLFLQVLDDGRLTDTLGRTIDFTNTIIIATSNVGSRTIQDSITEGVSFEELKKRLQNSLLEHYAPEFLNRFSGIVTFEPLKQEEIEKIVGLKLQKLAQQLEQKLITVTFSSDLIKKIAVDGFDPQWGARPLARLIADKLETKLAQEMLTGKIKKGDNLTIDQTFLV